MPDLQNLLDQINRLEKKSTPGPWVANDLGIGYEITTQQQMPINSGIKDTFPRSDAEFIALARTALPVLSQAVRAVLANLGQLEVKYDDYNAIDHIVHSITHELRQTITDALGDDDAA